MAKNNDWLNILLTVLAGVCIVILIVVALRGKKIAGPDLKDCELECLPKFTQGRDSAGKCICVEVINE